MLSPKMKCLLLTLTSYNNLIRVACKLIFTMLHLNLLNDTIFNISTTNIRGYKYLQDKIRSIMENINLKTALLNEQYEKIALLGENNDRKTWLVRQKNSNKIFVLKEIEIENISIYESLQYIKNRHLAAVKNIIEIENKAVVIEEYISGDILADKIENKNITKEDAVDYTCQLFEVLSELEKVNIVHRDITPKNILISSDNVVKLIDFGISRKTKEGRTKDTTILGTAGYAAPEQFGFMQTDIRSDIYSAGVVFHEMLTGKMPEGNKCICYDYKEFIQKCINISPENRFQTACQAYKELMKNYIHYDAKLNENAVKFTNSAYKTTGKQDTASVKKDYDYSKMPGFRSGALWKKILGVCVYVFLVTVMAVGFEKCKGNTQAVMYECAAAFMYVFSTVVIAGNYKNWYNRMPIYKDMDSVVKMFSRVILSIMIFYAGIQIEEYMKTIVK